MGRKPWHLILAVVASATGLGVSSFARAQPPSISIQEFTIPTAGSQPAVITQSGGNLYFTESGADKVGRSTAAGVITDVATRALVSGLDGIAADANGNLWITESATAGGHIIKANALLSSFSHSTAPPPCSPEARPRGIAEGPDGNMWVVMLQCNAILKFPATFSPGAGFTYLIPTASAGLARITAGPDGAMWFTESSANKIGRITTSGTITEFPLPTAGSGPHGIVAGPDGALWFTQSTGNRIGRITTAGAIAEYPLPTASSGPREIVAGPDGALWFTQFNANKIGRISTSGGITEYPVPTAASGPSGVTNGPGNTLWFTELNGNQLGRFLVRPVRGDFNRDGKADLFWRNSATGENYVYPMDGRAVLPGEGYVRTVADQNWQVAGTGDFDGDGRADVLWRNASSGENYVYLMNGTAIAGEGYLRTVADLNWRVAGVGDFDRDGRDDILWRNAATGENYVYFMSGVSIANEGYLRTVSSQDWTVAGVGDLDGDGRDDIVWRNTATGENYLYLMNGTAIAGEGYLRTVANQDWRIASVADFDGDGKADLLWRNSSSGENYLYPMSGTAILAGEGYLRTVANADWRIAATGDYDGDGKADIFWRNAGTGENYVYHMQGTSIAHEGYGRTVADQAWQIASHRAEAPPASGSQGTEFHLAFTDHRCVSEPAFCDNAPVSIKLRIASATDNSGQVGFNGMLIPFSVAANAEAVIALPLAAVLTSNETVEAKGIRVTTLNPVSVHAVSETLYSAGGYLAQPSAKLGTQYIVVSRGDSTPGLNGSSFAVVATQDNTVVTITPAAAGATKPAGASYDIMLNAGQSYQLMNPSSGDMTGSTLAASKPVAVFGGHRCANLPSSVGFCDYLIEQLPDATRLGTVFHLVPFSGKRRYTVRLVGTADGTALNFNPPPPGACAVLNAGQSCEFFASARLEIIATAPLLVAQFMHGLQDENPGFEAGDPSMVLVPPREQAATDLRFSVHGLEGMSSTYVNIVAPTASLAGLTLDGTPVDPGLFSPIGSLGYSGGAVPLAPGPHRLRGAAPFTALVYGIGADTSYAYPAGLGF